MKERKISLVLGSGGARGLAHIGVIRCLEAHGFDIRYISGCSIGALIGGIYAAGKLDVYADWVTALERRDVLRLLDWSLSREALFSGERLISELRELIGEQQIEELPVGFTAVATELEEEREVWLNRGPLWDAIRASMSVPIIFKPVERNGRLLVDGGLINPVPIAPALNDDSDLVAVDLNGHEERLEAAEDGEQREAGTGNGDDAASPTGQRFRQLRARITAFVDELMPASAAGEDTPPSGLEMALRSMDVMQTTIARMKLAAYSPKLLIGIPRNLCTFFEFHRAKELIAFGYRRTEQVLEREGYR